MMKLARCPGSSVATAWADSWPACMPAALRNTSTGYGWRPVARRSGAASPHRAAGCCRWSTASCHGSRSARACCMAVASASVAPRHAD
ncbi:hypothetical protein G6F62_013022 [Rhizopus arrhizus]|nr:hypothetical protein G6F62_013022 [Rhizopus arrhizus]